MTPIPVEGDDEVARLASAFNQMLASLAASRDRQRRLVADAGHELRTPLTSLRTNIDLLTQAGAVAARTTRAPSCSTDVRAQIEELTTLVGDLVELARDEPHPAVIGTVELHEVLDQAVARVRRRAPTLSFAVSRRPVVRRGRRRRPRAGADQPARQRRQVEPARRARSRVALHGGAVTVDDEGTGIAEADLPHVFERFYRSAESRAMPGSGLGLSIVAQVAERHAGSVEAGRSPSGGTRMTFALPGAPSPKPVEPPAVRAGRRVEHADDRSRALELAGLLPARSGPARSARTAAARRAGRSAGGSRWGPRSPGSRRAPAAGSRAAASTSPTASRCRRRW